MNSFFKTITSAALILILLTVMVHSRPVGSTCDLITALEGELSPVKADPAPAGISETLKRFDDGLFHRSDLIYMNGAIAKALGIRGYYSDQGILVYDGNYIVSPAARTSTDYETAQMNRLNEVLKARGVGLIYVNAPSKYLDDNIIINSFGIDSHVNDNQDRFISRLREETDIPCVDLREDIAAQGMDIYNLFYRTDHHWKVPTGKWAACRVAQALNESLGFGIDLSLFDDDSYTVTEYRNAWIGEQGRKISEGYIGRDDFVCMEPRAECQYVVTRLKDDKKWSGGFEVLLDKSVYETGTPGKSWHYSYMPHGLDFNKTVNQNVERGKLLLLCDSYGYVVVPFLSGAIHEITTVIMRDFDGDLLQLIQDNDYDAVVVLYAGFMIGAHDNPSSANYKMFAFDPSL